MHLVHSIGTALTDTPFFPRFSEARDAFAAEGREIDGNDLRSIQHKNRQGLQCLSISRWGITVNGDSRS